MTSIQEIYWQIIFSFSSKLEGTWNWLPCYICRHIIHHPSEYKKLSYSDKHPIDEIGGIKKEMGDKVIIFLWGWKDVFGTF